jgi:hypothetical protein
MRHHSFVAKRVGPGSLEIPLLSGGGISYTKTFGANCHINYVYAGNPPKHVHLKWFGCEVFKTLLHPTTPPDDFAYFVMLRVVYEHKGKRFEADYPTHPTENWLRFTLHDAAGTALIGGRAFQNHFGIRKYKQQWDFKRRQIPPSLGAQVLEDAYQQAELIRLELAPELRGST